MSPKIKISKEEIVKTALSLVREKGEEGINARAIAAALASSTQPIFSNFATMEELKAAVVRAAYEVYLDFIAREAKSGKYPKYKAFGMAYIRFAREEKELFKLLFMRDRRGEDLSPSPDFKESVKLIMDANGIDEEKATLLHLEMWCCVHGIGTMFATSYLSLEDELISQMISDVYNGVRYRLISEEN